MQISINRRRGIARLSILGVTLLVVVLLSGTPGVSAASQSAFSATYEAGRNGGTVTSLVASLNAALQLVEKAQAENASNPTLASSDLQKAQQLAQNVSSEAPVISSQGSEFRQAVFVKSVVAAVAIGAIAVLAYAFGGRIFRRVWLRLHSGYLVRSSNG